MTRRLGLAFAASCAVWLGTHASDCRAQSGVPRPSGQFDPAAPSGGSQGAASGAGSDSPASSGQGLGGTSPANPDGSTSDANSGANANPFSPGAGAADGIGTSPASGLGGAGSGNGGTLFGNMLGDQPPLNTVRIFQARPPSIPKPPGIPGIPVTPPQFSGNNRRTVAIIPSVRGFKIADNQSPQPQDRIYSSFNYYDNLNYRVNSRLNTPVTDFQVYRYIVGFEKTVLDGRGSVGLRLPIDNLSTKSTIPGLGGTSTSTGDLAAIFKYALINDPSGRIFSIGTIVSMPTGPNSFAGAKGFRSAHNSAIQPYMGFLRAYGDFYVQGFSSIDVPTSPHDVTVIYNDLGIGYYLYRADNLDQFLTAIVPTVEVHVNTPVNHSNPYNISDRAATYDTVDFTIGSNFQIRRRGLLSLGVNEPATGPRPYQIEAIAQFNLRF